MRKIKAFEVRGSDSGFTLIEMLIVIAVIAILAGVVLTGVSGFQASARDTRRIGDLRNAQNFMELFFNRCGYYPGGIDASGNCDTTDPADWDALKTMMETSGFTNNFPQDPVAGATYLYGVDTANNRLQYVLGATLERENQILNDDVDGTLFGVACDDPVYCVRN